MATASRQRPPSRPTTPSRRPATSNGTPAPVSRPSLSSREEPEGNSLFPFPVGAVIHGTQGVGKTAIMAHLPKVGFVVSKKEKGIVDLVRSGQAPEPEFMHVFDNGFDLEKNPPWDELLAHNWEISAGKYPGVENVVFDSMTFIQSCGFRRDCLDNYEGKFDKEGFFSFQQGPKGFATGMYTNFLDSLEAIKDAGTNVWLIAHTTVKGHAIPGEATYDRYIPYLDKEVWMQTLSWAQLVLFNNFEATVQKTGPEKQNRGRVQKNSQVRMLYTERTEAHDAKNRWGLEPVIVCGDNGKETYEKLERAFSKCFT